MSRPSSPPDTADVTPSQPSAILALLGESEPEEDVFAQLEQKEELDTDEPQAPTNGQAVVEDSAAPQNLEERDFSDLLAEFEAGSSQEPVAQAPELQHDGEATVEVTPESLAQPAITTPGDSPAPDLSIENPASQHPGDSSIVSMFSDVTETSDWLADTSIDSSFQVDAGHDQGGGDSGGDGSYGGAQLDGQFGTDEQAYADKEELPFEVPQGWYDDNGEFRWYTEEEKEQVRLTMLGQAVIQDPVDPVGEQVDTTPYQPPSSLYSPALQAGVSENAARRTPQIEQPPTMPTTSYPSLYAPSSSAQPTAPSAPHASQSYFFDASQSASPYDPYAPPAEPYAPPSTQPYGRQPVATSSRNEISRGPAPLAKKLEPPKRVASTAYDPPFLRPQKSHARIVPSHPAPTPLYSPPTVMSPPQPPPVAPPSGPPRRGAATPKIKDSAITPQYAQPPLPARSTSIDYRHAADLASRSAVAVPSGPPHALHRPAADALSQSQPPKVMPLAPFASFDPPLRPPSSSTRLAVASPPARSFTPPALTFSPPPENEGSLRPASRGPPSRRQSPLPTFEARPPSRPQFDAPPPRSLEPPAEVREANGQGQSSPLSRFEQRVQEDEAGHEVEERSAPHFSPWRPVLRNRDHEDDRSFGGSHRDYASSVAPAGPPPLLHKQSSLGLSSITPPPLPSEAAQYDPYAPESSQEYSSLYDREPSQPSQDGHVSRQPHSDYHATNAWAPPSGLNVSDVYAPGSHLSEDTKSTASQYAPSTSYEPTHAYAASSSPSKIQEPFSRYQPSHSTTAYAPISYAPVETQARAASPMQTSDFGGSPPSSVNYFQGMHMSAASDETYVPQQVLEQRPLSEDPLGRCTLAARNAPLAVFGFGGTIITAFPAMAESDDHTPGHARIPSYGYASGRGQLWLRKVSDVVSTSALRSSDNPFPGPLILDPSVPKSAAGDKKKRDAITTYLEARAEEIEKGLPYLKSSASAARREEEGKLVLVRLLLALVLGEGKFIGSEKVRDAVHLALQNPSAPTDATVVPPPTLARARSESHPATFGSIYTSKHDVPTTPASSAQLTHLSSLLLAGDKREATHYAANNGLWSHALIIASCVGQDLWNEIAARFAAAELQGQAGTAALKASYALFSATLSAPVDELLAAANITDDPSADQWREVISAIIFNGNAAQQSCLDDLGARLLSMGLTNAAQVCFLLSSSSPFADLSPASLDKPIPLTQNGSDEDAIILAEVAEYARGLIPVPKSQEVPIVGLPRLLPYKLHRAWLAAELGDVDQSLRYCNAVEAASKTGKGGPTLLQPAHQASLEDLLERLTGTPSVDPAKGIGARKSAKPTLGSWIEGRLTKFIAGDEDGNGSAQTKAPAAKSTLTATPATIGPFSHFSTISPAQSGNITRNHSTADLTAPNGNLGVYSDSRRTSPSVRPREISHLMEGSSSYGGDQYSQRNEASTSGGWTSWGASQTPTLEESDSGMTDDKMEEVELLNPMAMLSIGSSSAGQAQQNYAPPAAGHKPEPDGDDEDDLGFGNKALSRHRTPKPADGAGSGKDESATPKAESQAPPPAEESPSKPAEHKSWLGKWWGRKEGEGHGPIKAKLGEDSSMVFDPELKRWIVKGAKPPPAAAAPPPPPRAQTVSPSRTARPDAASGRAVSATPPPSHLGPQRSMTAGPMGPPGPHGSAFAETADGGIRRLKSSLADASSNDHASTGTGAAPGPPHPGHGPPSRPPSGGPSRPPTGASIDDLLSRPPSKRPSSAAKKPMRNRYVDVFQPGAEGSQS